MLEKISTLSYSANMLLKLEKGWQSLLEEELSKPYMDSLKKFVSEELERGESVYPPLEKVFHAFLYTPYEKVKVVIMGQDPYHGRGQAHGLSFSVEEGVALPPSLKNIYKELVADLGVPVPESGSLIAWAKQGVLLLNATLTVAEAKPKSHYGKGWEMFTDAVVAKLAEREDPMVFLLWGASAQEKCTRILSTRSHPHIALKAAHPSPFSVTGFSGCRHFSKANSFLEKWGKSPIDWRVS
jgi:uracil-DNA glycosylase